MMNEIAETNDADPSIDRCQEKSMFEVGAPLWTVEDVAGYLQLQPDTIRGMARRGELPAIKLGKVWRFHMSAITHLLAKIT